MAESNATRSDADAPDISTPASKSIADVEAFWDANPLFTGEAEFTPDTADSFFARHDAAYYDDVFSGIDYEQVFFLPGSGDRTLDLGCGIGFWSSLFFTRYGVGDLVSGDLSARSLEICKQRVPGTTTRKTNAEATGFEDAAFDFINCQGVIHHTPDTQACLDEIHRILAPGGRASVSVYYENALVKLAGVALPLVTLASRLFLKDKGRGRAFHTATSKDDIVRLYDGAGNPIGKCYGRAGFEAMLRQAGFTDIRIGYFFFPFRFVRIPLPGFLRTTLVRLFPFIIVANVTK